MNNSPLSVVIVGVGNDDFAGMEFLDNMSQPGFRDLADFINFNVHSNNPAELTSVTLAEIPRHLVELFQKRGIQPNAQETVNEAEIAVGDEEEEIDLSLNWQEEEIVVARGGVAYSKW